ncbi:MAG: 2-dehydropantoate 2-reductase N-terminal domain-containing protein, partial [Actinomycetota bacterium]|nr:2-dehydropantoate 2-reductase N-terminal domain-containing protein [Actinomycetota bacterium]
MVARSVTIIGPGAIGAAVGASLIDSGHDVSFASRTPFEVLDVTHPDGRVLQEIDCVSDPAAATISDTVMLAV